MRARGRTILWRGARAMTLVELLLALVVTSFVGLGVASMLQMVGGATAADQDRRSVLLRALTAQVRLRAYVSQSLCILQHDGKKGMAVWLHDGRPQGNVHLSEFRVIWFDEDAERLTVERVEFPDDWTPAMKEANDAAVSRSTDFFKLMETLRGQGFTRTEVLADGVAWTAVEFNAADPQDADRVTFRFGLNPGSLSGGASGSADIGTREALTTFGISGHTKPAA